MTLHPCHSHLFHLTVSNNKSPVSDFCHVSDELSCPHFTLFSDSHTHCTTISNGEMVALFFHHFCHVTVISRVCHFCHIMMISRADTPSFSSHSFYSSHMSGQPLNCILQPHSKIMAEHQVIATCRLTYKISLKREDDEGKCQFILTLDITTVKWEFSENKTRVTGVVLLYIYYTSPDLSSNRISFRYSPIGYDPAIRWVRDKKIRR